MKIIRIDPSLLDSGKKRAYTLLTEPPFRSYLSGKSPYNLSFGSLLALGAEEGGTPVGLCLVSIYKELQFAEVHSLFVQVDYRRKGIGTALINSTEEICQREGCSFIQCAYRKEDSTAPYLEKIFHHQEWSGPRLFMTRYFYDAFGFAYSFHPSWYDHPPPLPHRFTEFPWAHLKDQEKKEVQEEYRQGHFSASVSPFLREEPFEKINSLGLRYKKKVIGWMITHRIAPDTIRYTALYVRPEHQLHGLPIRLLVDSLKLHQASGIRWALFEINLAETSRSWLKFVQRRLAPYAQITVHLYQYWKSFPQKR